MEITLSDLVSLMADPGFFNLSIYDVRAEEIIYTGLASDIPMEYTDLEVMSIDSPYDSPYICFNVETEE